MLSGFGSITATDGLFPARPRQAAAEPAGLEAMAGVWLGCVGGISVVPGGLVLAGTSQACSWFRSAQIGGNIGCCLLHFHIKSRPRAEPTGCAMCGSACHSFP